MEFYQRWRENPLVLDKWFSVQALSQRSDTVEQVSELTRHPDFLVHNPNRVRSLLGVFTQNQVQFHRRDGAGYRLIADFVITIDANNPQLAARLVSAFNSLVRFDGSRREEMRRQLERILNQPKPSNDVYEIAERALSF